MPQWPWTMNISSGVENLTLHSTMAFIVPISEWRIFTFEISAGKSRMEKRGLESRRTNAANKVRKAGGGYHETMTQAWLAARSVDLNEFCPAKPRMLFDKHTQLSEKRGCYCFIARF